MPVLLCFATQWFHVLLPFMIAIHAVAAVAANVPNSQTFGRVVTRFQTDKREVWLTIDDGPSPQDTPTILELLKRHNARATFLSVGQRIESHPEVARAVVEQGHELANHTHTHPVWWFSCSLPNRVAREIDGCTQAIKGATGISPRWFRPPLGLASCFVHFALRKRGMKLLGWSARGYDGVSRSPRRIVKRILRDIRPGAIVLLHEGKRDSKNRAINVLALKFLLRELATRGYSCTIPAYEDI